MIIKLILIFVLKETDYILLQRKNSKIKEYNNSEACNRCSNKSKFTKAKNGKVIRRNESSQSVDNMILRLETCKDKYPLRKSIVEHPFGTLKRNINFTYILLRNLKNVRGEISIAFFTYNLKKSNKSIRCKRHIRIHLYRNIINYI